MKLATILAAFALSGTCNPVVQDCSDPIEPCGPRPKPAPLPPKPQPEPSDHPATCADACAWFRARNCPQAEATPRGATCEQVCSNAGELFDNDCVLVASSCEAADRCVR
jgi:hypothetical protein